MTWYEFRSVTREFRSGKREFISEKWILLVNLNDFDYSSIKFKDRIDLLFPYVPCLSL